MGPKLVFYSDQVLPEGEKVDRELVRLLGKPRPTMAFVGSSHGSRQYYEERRAYYARYGIDLPVYLGPDPAHDGKLVEAALACDGIHLAGGDTFGFLRWLRAAGLLPALREYAAQGGVLVGVSAGAMLMTPDIGTATLCGDEAGAEALDLAALHLVDWAFVPHLDRVPAAVEALRRYSWERGIAVYGCRDGDGIVVEGEQVRCLGDVVVVDRGQVVARP